MRWEKWSLIGAILILSMGVACPPPVDNGNGNDNATANDNSVDGNTNANGAANTNANSSANANSNSTANTNTNTNTNGTANQNENAPANTNTNGAANQNENAPANTNSNTNSNTNTNENSNTNTNANSNSSGTSLTANQQFAVNGAVLALKDANKVLGMFHSMSNTLIDFTSLSNLNVLDSICPPLVHTNTSSTNVLFTLNAGAGCAAPPTDDLTVTGEMQMTFSRSSRLGNVSYNSFAVGGVAVGGTAALTCNGGGIVPASFSGSTNLTYGSKTFVGSTVALSIVTPEAMIDPDKITLNATDWSLFDGSFAHLVDLSNVVFNPQVFDSFAPFSGTLTFTPPGEPEIVITFGANSITTGEVQVSIGGAAAVLHTVTGLGG